jgi:nitroimidazol reductase NimA-like FMN-containing flavoprotein (pyridoxamine 5'-phosphate oxidase superfamily)
MKILDASEPEFGGPMTEDEVRFFLVNSHKNVHISSLDEKGEPNIHPTWYYFDNNNDKLYIESGRESKKTRNLRRNNIIYYCIDDDNIHTKEFVAKEQYEYLMMLNIIYQRLNE